MQGSCHHDKQLIAVVRTHLYHRLLLNKIVVFYVRCDWSVNVFARRYVNTVMTSQYTFLIFLFYKRIVIELNYKREESGGNGILVRNVIAQQIALNKTITQNN